MQAIIFIGSGKISYGKLAQALDHGQAVAGEVERPLGLELALAGQERRDVGGREIGLRYLASQDTEGCSWPARGVLMRRVR